MFENYPLGNFLSARLEELGTVPENLKTRRDKELHLKDILRIYMFAPSVIRTYVH